MPPKGEPSAKKAKLYNSRTIRTDLRDPSFKEGKLSVPDFLSAREFEINSLEKAKLKAKYASSNRCFQSLPRTLRRRTASHNVKRIPKRLRNRAINEMQNSVNGVPPKPKLPRGKALYKLKMATKLLKLASKIKELRSQPLQLNEGLKLRSRLKLLNKQRKALQKPDATSKYPLFNNKMGSYDNTGVNEFAPLPKGNLKYTKRQREYVWLPTHVWHAKRAHMIKKHGYQIPYSPTQKSFKSINRASKQDAICYDTSYYDIMVVRTVSAEQRSHILREITKFGVSGKEYPKHFALRGRTYDDWLYMKGKVVGKGMVLSYEGGDADSAGKILIRLHPSLYKDYFEYVKELLGKNGDIHDCRYSLGSLELSGPKALHSISKIFHLHRTGESGDEGANWLQLASKFDSNNSIPSGTTFSFSVQDPRLWSKPTNPPKRVLGDTVSFNDFMISITDGSRDIINPQSYSQILDTASRYESYKDQMTIKELSKLKSDSKSVGSSQSSIPILLTKLQSSGNWSIIVPWYWILPIWIELVKVTELKFGGISQMHQVNFENGKPTFPTDFPFLRDGFLENEFNVKEKTKKYNAKPSSHKIDLENIEHGNFHGSDWRYLQLVSYGREILRDRAAKGLIPATSSAFGTFDKSNVELNSLTDLAQLIKRAKSIDEEKKAGGKLLPLPITLYEKTQHASIPSLTPTMTFPPLPVVQISISFIGKGNPDPNARIYSTSKENKDHACPMESLVGFLTSATFNLNLGKGTGIGCVNAYYAKANEIEKLVLVKNIGCSVPRLAKWNYI